MGLFFLSLSGLNLYWKGIHFSWSNFLVSHSLFFHLIISFHFWFRDLLREFIKKYEILLSVLFLAFLLFLVSEGLLFVSFFWATFHSLFSFILAWTFVSLQIKEFRIMGLSINDS